MHRFKKIKKATKKKRENIFFKREKKIYGKWNKSIVIEKEFPSAMICNPTNTAKTLVNLFLTFFVWVAFVFLIPPSISVPNKWKTNLWNSVNILWFCVIAYFYNHKLNFYVNVHVVWSLYVKSFLGLFNFIIWFFIHLFHLLDFVIRVYMVFVSSPILLFVCMSTCPLSIDVVEWIWVHYIFQHINLAFSTSFSTKL